jgi:hypothetical protein
VNRVLLHGKNQMKENNSGGGEQNEEAREEVS